MPVMQIGIMRVLVDETAMLVRMAVRVAIRIGWRMDVLMMRVVHMPMLVNKGLVHMLVLVFFRKMQIHARRHERGSRDQEPCDGLGEQRNRDHSADKGRGRKIRPGAGRTEMAQPQHKECEANAITEEADDRGRCKGPFFGQLRAMGKAQRSIDDAGGNTLDHGELDRIGGAELAGQVVIDAPADAGRDDQRTPPAHSYRGTVCWPGQYERAGQYGHGAGKQAAIDVLTEEDPGDHHGDEALGVEKKRTGASRCERQSRHQQRRTENAAKKDDQAEPREIAPLLRLCLKAGRPGR
jgi:hypothetical protein